METIYEHLLYKLVNERISYNLLLKKLLPPRSSILLLYMYESAQANEALRQKQSWKFQNMVAGMVQWMETFWAFCWLELNE